LASGELDFYINGNLGWGVEAMVQGHNIQGHTNRFGEQGKYRDLKCKQWRVVDFRSHSSIPSKQTIARANYIAVVFTADFSSATIFGLNEKPAVKFCLMQ
jgi:hypothetical protein